MFTVLVKDLKMGVENLYSAKRVQYTSMFEVGGPSLLLDIGEEISLCISSSEKSDSNVPSNKTAYIMNDKGATVAVYSL